MTDEQKARIAMAYEARLLACMNDGEQFDKLMAEFEEIKKGWDAA